LEKKFMKQTGKLLIAGSIGALALAAQNLPMTTSFQQVGTLQATGRGAPSAPVFTLAGKVIGKPFSGTITTQTKLTYSDGTNILRTNTTVYYRDNDGRTRQEFEAQDGAKNITISDPVAGVLYNLDVATKTGTKRAIGGLTVRRVTGGTTTAPDGVNVAVEFTPRGGGVAPGGRGGSIAPGGRGGSGAAAGNSNSKSEDLGTMTVNGVAASGTRVTTIIPAGAIGNDREMRSVNESWFSPDLNMVIKSVATDPRFGTTTHEVANISRANPDRSFFEPPSDYTINEQK
jgi:hypothetical protein